MPVIREVTIKLISFILLTISLVITNVAIAEESKNEVVLETNKGTIVIALNAVAAPETVDNFKKYVESGFYNDTIFHRIIPNFMIQGGGFKSDLTRKSPQAPIQNGADNGLLNTIGTIAMARTGDPHSATSQFFINVNDNIPLDFKEKSFKGWGYTVFGKVIEGLDIVLSISQQTTTSKRPHANLPVDAIIIQKAFLR